jgi:hypothetical protein
MIKRTLTRAVILSALLTGGGCALISPDQSAEALKANAEKRTSFTLAANKPADACAKTARMLMWCAGGPNYHYRCNTPPDGSRSDLSGTLEAVYRTEFFMVTEFVRSGADASVTVHQHDSVLIYDYAPMIQAYFNNSATCLPR